MVSLEGQSLGRYHILEQLGEGGMATVYRAYDTQLERDVAVKVIRRGAFPPDQLYRILKRFEREAKALGRLTHPNIISVIDYGEYEDSPYLVMPYIAGGTLKQRIKRGELPWQEAARLLIPIAHALEYAHQQGIIHRDIKPSNILLAEAGEPMLSDFGVAKLFENEETAELTGTGMGVGTPEYMAPEQTGKHIDHRVDIYALGIVLYEMVTGRRPYEADTPLAVLMKQASEPLPRPKQFTPNLPSGLEKVIIKALAKKPDERYQSMGEVAKALEGLIVVKAPPVEKKPKEPEKLSQARWIDWRTVGGVAMVLLAMIALVTLWKNRSVATQLFPFIKSQNPNIITQASTPLVNTNPSVINTPQYAITKSPVPALTPTPVAAALPVEITDSKGVTMRLVPAGEFTMGSTVDDALAECLKTTGDNCNRDWFIQEEPPHTVKLDDYYMDVYEVTNAQYKACVDAGTCQGPSYAGSHTRSYYYGNPQYDNFPIIYVDWAKAKAYCDWRGARLPTEAEWEKAARGTDARIYPWGNASPFTGLFKVNFNNFFKDTTEVGSYESGKSPYGMYDMSGNVSEWVNDWFDSDYYQNSPAEDPQGPAIGDARVLRGGSWDEGLIFAFAREAHYSLRRHEYLGFRCASSVPPATASTASAPQLTDTPITLSPLMLTVGTWVKEEPIDCCFERVEIRTSEGKYFVHVWSGTRPSGDWGEQQATISNVHTTYSPDADEFLQVVWEPTKDYKVIGQISVLSDGTLEIWTHDNNAVGKQVLVRK